MTKKEALALMENGYYQEAYEAFNNLYLANKKDYEALYFRSLLDFVHLKQNFEQSIDDFELLITVKHQYLANTLHILTAIYNELNEYENVIRVGKRALEEIIHRNMDSSFLLLPYFALARAYYHRDSDEDLETALNYVNKGLELTKEEPDADYYWLKTDILIILKRFDEAKQVITEMISKIPNEPIIYFSQARLASEMGYYLLNNGENDKGEKLLNDALEYLNVYENYSNEDIIYNLKVDILLELGHSDAALKLIDENYTKDNAEENTLKKIDTLCLLNRKQEAIELCNNYLKKDDSLEIKLQLARLLYIEGTSSNHYYELAKPLVDELIEKKQTETIILIFSYVYNALEKYQEAYEKLTSFFDDEHMTGQVAYILGELATELELDYDLQEYYYIFAYKNNYLNQLSFLSKISSITAYPKNKDKLLLNYLNLPISEMSAWTCYEFGCMYLNGNTKIKPNYDKAYTFFKKASEIEPKTPCFLTAIGRVYEFKRDYQQMIKYYQEAHKLNLENETIDCVCTFGYLAHAYINGLGVKKNLDIAKELIIEAISHKGIKANNNVSYLYAYFALNNESDFNLEYAYQLLNKQSGFNRYEISKYMMLKQICMALNKNPNRFDEQIKECLKFADHNEKKYYKENIKKKISYPHFKYF